MEILIRGNKLEITEAMSNFAKEKLARLEKYFKKDQDVKANVLVKIRNYTQKVEITIPLKSFILRVEEEGKDFYATIDIAIDKLERQIRKNKTRLEDRNKKNKIKELAFDAITNLEEDLEEKIVKRKKIEIKPMSEEEAILQMELLGHQFYVYKDASTNKIAVVYKRTDAGYGIIETE